MVIKRIVPDALEDVRALLDLQGDRSDNAPRERAVVDLLIFELGIVTFALRAQQVEEVIAWRAPLPLPRADPRVMGIIQDRGRIIVILSDPTGGWVDAPSRIVVCRTHRGYVGLPAGKTRCVGAVKIYGELLPKAVVDTSEGVVTFLDAVHFLASSEGPAQPSAASSGRDQAPAGGQ